MKEIFIGTCVLRSFPNNYFRLLDYKPSCRKNRYYNDAVDIIYKNKILKYFYTIGFTTNIMILPNLFLTSILLMCCFDVCMSTGVFKRRCKISVTWRLKNVTIAYNETGILKKSNGEQQNVLFELMKLEVINETVFDTQCCDGYFANDKNSCKKCPYNTFGNNCTGVCKCGSYKTCDHVTGECKTCSTKSCEESLVTSSDSTDVVAITSHLEITAYTDISTEEPSNYKTTKNTQVGNCTGGDCKAEYGLSAFVCVVCIGAKEERWHHRMRNMINDYIPVNNILRRVNVENVYSQSVNVENVYSESVNVENVYSENVNVENDYIPMTGIVGRKAETEERLSSIIRDEHVTVNINHVISDVNTEMNLIGLTEVTPYSNTDYDFLAFY